MTPRARAPSLVVLGLVSSGCGGGDLDTAEFRVPPADEFAFVAPTMVRHCGSLDCHGVAERNLRLYGQYGLRLDPQATSHETPTTSAEVDVDYRAVISVEPEILADVFASGGERPERLTLIRKARGAEKHVGKARFPEGSPGDRCLVSFLAGAVDGAACITSLTEDP
jgi:hypothetical protein